VLSIQPRTGPAAGSVSGDDLVANMARDILANLPAPLLREDASIAKDPFAVLPTGANSCKSTGHMAVFTSWSVNQHFIFAFCVALCSLSVFEMRLSVTSVSSLRMSLVCLVVFCSLLL